MSHPDKLRQNLKLILRRSMRLLGLSHTDLADMTGLTLKPLGDALGYGRAETGDLLLICRALGLDISAAIAEAANHTVETPATQPEMPEACYDAPTPEVYPA